MSVVGQQLLVASKVVDGPADRLNKMDLNNDQKQLKMNQNNCIYKTTTAMII